MKAFISSLVFAMIFSSSFSQEVWIYQPDAETGKDAFIYTLEPFENLGDHPNFMASAWTNGGEPTVVRCLIDVIPEGFPEGVEIIDARLSLYSYDSPSNGPHSTISGSNATYLQRIVEPWSETEVNWMNQPETTTQNQVTLQASAFSIQDYEDIDITALVQDMMANPDQDHGLLMKLITEDYYRAMVFGSSDNDNPELWPKIEITYEAPLAVDDLNGIDFRIFPNPCDSWTRVQFQEEEVGRINVFDQMGKLLDSKGFSGSSEVLLDLSHLADGIYTLQCITENGTGSEKLVVSR